MNEKQKPTIVCSVRTDYRNLATVYKYYQSIGIKVESVSSLCRMAIEDFCNVLVANEKSSAFPNLSDAISFCSPLRKQATHADKNRLTVAKQISMEAENIDPGFKHLSDDEIERIIKEMEEGND